MQRNATHKRLYYAVSYQESVIFCIKYMSGIHSMSYKLAQPVSNSDPWTPLGVRCITNDEPVHQSIDYAYTIDTYNETGLITSLSEDLAGLYSVHLSMHPASYNDCYITRIHITYYGYYDALTQRAWWRLMMSSRSIAFTYHRRQSEQRSNSWGP